MKKLRNEQGRDIQVTITPQANIFYKVSNEVLVDNVHPQRRGHVEFYELYDHSEPDTPFARCFINLHDDGRVDLFIQKAIEPTRPEFDFPMRPGD